MIDLLDDFKNYTKDSADIIYAPYFKPNKINLVFLDLESVLIISDKKGHINQNISFSAKIKSAFLNEKLIRDHKCNLVFPRKTFYNMLMKSLNPEQLGVFFSHKGICSLSFYIRSYKLYELESYELFPKGEGFLEG